MHTVLVSSFTRHHRVVLNPRAKSQGKDSCLQLGEPDKTNNELHSLFMLSVARDANSRHERRASCGIDSSFALAPEGAWVKHKPNLVVGEKTTTCRSSPKHRAKN